MKPESQTTVTPDYRQPTDILKGRMRATLIAVAAAVGVAIAGDLASIARGDEGSRQKAEALFRAGLEAFKKGDFQQAEAQFTKAYALYPRGSVLRNLGLTEMELGRPLDALTHFRAALTSADLGADQRSLAQRNIDEAFAQTGHIAIHANGGAALLVDGQRVGNAPIDEPIDVLTGRHRVEARLGIQSIEIEVAATAGAVVTAEVLMSEPRAAPPPSRDALPVPATTASSSPTSPPPSSTVSAPFLKRGSSGTLRVVVTATLGVGVVAGIVTGIVVLAGANRDRDRASGLLSGLPENACVNANGPPCATAQQAAQNEASEKNLSTGLFIGAAVLATGAIATWFLWSPNAKAPASATFVPALSPTAAILALRGTFH